MSIFTGSGVAICTPFDKENKFNPNVYEKLIKFHFENHTDAIISCGTTGEVSTLTTDEHVDVVKTAVESAKKYQNEFKRKMPIVGGGGGNDTAKCCEIGKKLQQVGADALMFVSPYYNKTSQKGLVTHYSKIASSVDLPIIVYNVASRTGINISPKTMEELSKIPNIVAVKEASGDISQICEVFERCGDGFDVYSGNDDHIVPVLSMGGKGVISTIANIMPNIVHRITAEFFNGKLEESRTLQIELLPLIRLLFSDVNPMPVKYALTLKGFDVGLCRLPLVEIEDSLKEALKKEFERIDKNA